MSYNNNDTSMMQQEQRQAQLVQAAPQPMNSVTNSQTGSKMHGALKKQNIA